MTDFMEYCLKQYYRSAGWNEENQYSYLCSWSNSVLDFQTLRSLSSVISRLPTTTYNNPNAVPALHGNIGYIYTTRPLDIGNSATVEFQDLLDRFNIVTRPTTTGKQDPVYMIYGHMFFPGAKLEAMYTRRLSKYLQCLVTAVNYSRTFVSPQIAIKLQRDKEKWCSEWSYTLHNGVFSMSTMYNLSQWSAGTEVYYGMLDKSRGFTTGIRYRTLTTSAPVSLTCTYNPIVGNISTSYTAKASDRLVLSSRYDYNFKSLDNNLALGLEYRTKTSSTPTNRNDEVIILKADESEKVDNLFKLRWSFAKGLGFLWQGRIKSALFSLGVTADLQSTTPIQSFGFEIQYFS